MDISKDMNKEHTEPNKNIPEGWTTPPELADLKQNFNDCKSDHDLHKQKRQEYRDQLNITGSAKIPARKGFSVVQPKLIRKHAEWRYSALSEAFLATQEMFTLNPRTHQDKLAATQNSIILNYQWNNVIDKVPFVDELVRTGVDEGTYFIRLGWESEEEEVTEIVPIYDFYPATEQAQVEELQKYAMIQQSDPYAYQAHVPEHIQQALQLTNAQGAPIYPVLVEEQEVTKVVVVKNQPTAEVCNTDNLYIDPLCNGNLDKAEFTIYSFETSKSELRKSGANYFNLKSIKQDTGSILASPDHSVSNDDSAFNFKDDARTKFIAYEYWGYWDVDGSGVTTPIVVTWVNDTIIRMEENPYPDKKIPYVSDQYLPVRKSTYGEPDGVLLKDNQAIIGAVTRGAIDIMARSANGQKGMRQDMLDTTNRRKYDNGEDFEFNPMADPRQGVIDFTYPEIPNSVGLMLNGQEQDANNMTGVRPFGATDSSAGTATADRGVLDAATKRETGILRRFGRTMQLVAKKIIAMNGEFLSDEEIIRVTDNDFVAIRREELAGNFDIEVTITTAEEDENKAKELAFMLQTVGPSDDPAITRMIRADIARLRKMPALAKKLEDYKPEPDPIAEEMRMLELEKLRAEVGKIQTDAMKNQSSAQLDMAKAQETGAKAGNLQSDTDQKNLDFLDQESGVKHAREVQQNKAQAEGNMALEILKAELNPKPQVSK